MCVSRSWGGRAGVPALTSARLSLVPGAGVSFLTLLPAWSTVVTLRGRRLGDFGVLQRLEDRFVFFAQRMSRER